MKLFALAIFLFMTTVVMCYDEKYDKIDIDKILADDKLYMSYVNCYLDKGPCDAEMSAEFKELLPEVLNTACGKCTIIQKKNIKKILKALFEKKPELLIDFQKKYDPDNRLAGNVKKILLD